MRRASPGWPSLALALGAASLWAATAPRALPQAELAALPAGDAARGETLVLGRRLRLLPRRRRAPRATTGCGSAAAGCSTTPFGDFSVPNISPDPADGIGGWTAADFANAMLRGVVARTAATTIRPSPTPPTSRMPPQDVADLWAFLAHAAAGRRPGAAATTSASPSASAAASASGSSPSSTRRAGGRDRHLRPAGRPRPVPRRGAGPLRRVPHAAQLRRRAGPRAAGSPARPSPEGEGRIPNITAGGATSATGRPPTSPTIFETGFTPDFDTAGGAMVEVQRNLADARRRRPRRHRRLPQGGPGGAVT